MVTRFTKQVWQGWLVSVIVFPLVIYAIQASLVEVATGKTVTQAEVELVSSDSQSVVLSLSSPPAAELLSWLEQAAIEQGGETEALGMTSEVGAVQLPVYRTLVGIPADAAYELVVWSESQTVVKNVGLLSPVPRAIPLAEGQTGAGVMEAVRDEHFYASRAVYPEAAVKIVDDAWFRNQRVLKVEFYPLQYLPSEEDAYWHPHLRAEIRLKTSGVKMGKLSERSIAARGDDAFDGIMDGLIINRESAREWLALPDMPPQIQDFPITDGHAGLKLVVTHPGIYQVSYEEMDAAGMNLNGVNPANFHLLSLDQAAAYDFLGDTDSIFEPGEKIIFYGEGLPSLRLEAKYQAIMTPLIAQCPSVCRVKDLIENYTDENVYWLYVGDEPGMRMNTVEGEPTSNFQVSTYFTDTQHAEGDFIWHPTNLTSADVWFWKRARPSTSLVYTLPITLGVVAPLSGQAVVRGELMARADTPHITRIYLNNTAILTSTWSGIVRYPFEKSIDPSLLLDGVNNLRFQVVVNGFPQDIYFDWFEITYGREYSAEADRLAFEQTQVGSWRYVVDGLESSGGVVLDISVPLQPRKIQDVSYLIETQAVFELINQAALSIFVAGSGGVESPKSITWYEPPELEPPAGADYIFITHKDFMEATQRLADYRSSQGLRTVVVDVADVYNQYNYGIFHTVAIRNYLEKAMLTWPGHAPRYVLLVGDASFELRPAANTTVDEINYLPPYLGIIDPWQGEMDGTSLLAAVVGTDIMPDLAIGRIPAKTTAEVDAVVDKTIAYELANEQEPLADWHRQILYVADNNDAGGFFRETSERLASAYTPSGYSADKYYYCRLVVPLPPDCYTSAIAVTHMITEQLNTEGALFLNYTGHGATPSWAGENLLHRDNLADLSNGAGMPVVLSWTCLDGYFLYPAFMPGVTTVSQTPTIIEALLMTPGKGAVATFSPTGLGVGTGHEFLAQGFYNTIFRSGIWDLGAASLGAKLKLFSSGSYDDLMKTYFIFGDPALRLPNPYGLSVAPESDAAEGVTGFAASYPITVTNTGPVADSYVVTVESSQWPVITGVYGPVEPGAQIVFQVRVEVPFGIAEGVVDTAVIRVASYGDRSKYERVTLTTTAVVYNYILNLPLIMR